MDKVVEEVEKAKKEWDETYSKVVEQIKAIEGYAKSVGVEKKDSLPRMNGLAQDGLALLNSLQFKLDLLAPQLPTDEQAKSAKSLLESWKNQSQSLRLSLRNANLQAKANMRKAAQEERELLLGGGGESTIRRRNLQTKAGMTSAAESITESLRRTRQLMVQEVERSASTLMTFGCGMVMEVWSLLCFKTGGLQFGYGDESTGVLKKAESEYKGHRSLLMRTRNLLSTMQRQDVMDRIILAVGFFLFACAVLYVVSKRIGILRLQRTVTAAFKAGVRQADFGRRPVENGVNPAQILENAVHKVEVPLERAMHDEL
ncbi:hypothetical protein FEM48_Zijuj11G0096300 [Ziziphus jujuba var. spinosa]|uniref:Sec20 C-terminal domain-containing protein n=1 Tax=Ziziphus jujuba var. spinosa TaxID=714518 RepID=A0A978UI72_ZIZJJ|nr:hypothetical protein FEM48_Zijuj11G0096300 [Ziziphus jujuba var. spinosa]